MVAFGNEQGSSIAQEQADNSIARTGRGPEGASTTPLVSEVRQEILDAFAKLDAYARGANPAHKDSLEIKADTLRAMAGRVANAEASKEEVAQFVKGTKELAADTNTELARRRNPWSLAVNSPLQEQDKKNYHQVVTLSVPSGQIVDLRQDSSHGCGGRSSCVRLCPGSIAAREVNGSKVWRQPDPKNPGFDLITVATSPDRTVQTKCGWQEIKAFSGVMKFTNPCTCESYAVNVNNGASNDHLKALNVAEGISVPDRAQPIIVSSTRPDPQVLEEASPNDRYDSAQFPTYSDYSAYVTRYNQLPGKYSVAREEKGLQVIVKDKQTLTLYNGGSEVGTFNPTLPDTQNLLQSNPGGIPLGPYATIKKGEHGAYVLMPGAMRMETEFFAKITEGGQTVAERVIFIGDLSEKSKNERPAEQGYNEEAARKLAPRPPTTETSLPKPGTRITSTEPVSFTLRDDVIHELYISKVGETPLGVLRPDVKANSFEFGGSSGIKIVRMGEGNTFRIFAADGAKEGEYILTARPRGSAAEIVKQTKITIGVSQPQASENITPSANDASPKAEEKPSQPQKELKNEGPDPSVKPPGKTPGESPAESPKYESMAKPQYISKNSAVRGEKGNVDIRQPDGSYKLPVTPGKSTLIDLYGHDEQGRRTYNAVSDLTFGENTIKTDINGVGSIRRVTEPDGKMYLVFTPKDGSRIGLSLAAAK
jgi:hypothetical protein